MALPKVETKFFETTLLSDPAKKIRFRKMKTREEKDFLLAVETGEADAVRAAIYALVEACTDVENARSLCPADVQKIAIEIKRISKGETFQFSWKCPSCGSTYTVNGNIDDDIEMKPAGERRITVGEFAFDVEPPSCAFVDSIDEMGDIEKGYSIVAASIKSVITEDGVYDGFTFDEIRDWVENELDADVFAELAKKIVEVVPTVAVKKTVSCANDDCEAKGKKHSVSVDDFSVFLS